MDSSVPWFNDLSAETRMELATLLDKRPEGLFAGGYKVEGFVGNGSMGHVVRSRCPMRGEIALKLMRPGRSDLARFENEIRVVQQMFHPCLLPILDQGETAKGHRFFVMPLLGGESLVGHLHRNPGGLAPEDVLTVAIDLAAGLSALHQRSVVHRDVKPGNIWVLDASFRVLLMDLGVSKQLDAGAGPGTSPHTTAGTILGSHNYAAPEQANGSHLRSGSQSDGIGPWSDLFSLGCVLYECFTGRRVFSTSSMEEYITRLATFDHEKDVELPDSKDQLAVELINLIRALLIKDPRARQERFRDANAVHCELVLLRKATSVANFKAMQDGPPRDAPISAGDHRSLTEWMGQIQQSVRQIQQLLSGASDSNATTFQMDTDSGSVRVFHRPQNVKDYESLFGGFNVGIFRAYNAPFFLENDEAIKEAGLKLQRKRIAAVESSRYLLFDRDSYENAKAHFSRLDKEMTRQQKAKVRLTHYYGLSEERHRLAASFAYFVGHRNDRARCVLYLLNPADRFPDVAIVCDDNSGLAEILVKHFEDFCDEIRHNPHKNDWSFDNVTSAVSRGERKRKRDR